MSSPCRSHLSHLAAAACTWLLLLLAARDGLVKKERKNFASRRKEGSGSLRGYYRCAGWEGLTCSLLRGSPVPGMSFMRPEAV